MNQTSNPAILIVLAIGLPVAYYWFQIARRKSGQIKFKLRRVIVYAACVLIGLATIPRYGYTVQDAALFSMAAGIALAFILVRHPSRSRYIPRHVRRAVIARDLKGERFDSKRHDIDHIVPYSKGGDHSIANLRVIEKSRNRSRGAKMPKLRDLS